MHLLELLHLPQLLQLCPLLLKGWQAWTHSPNHQTIPAHLCRANVDVEIRGSPAAIYQPARMQIAREGSSASCTFESLISKMIYVYLCLNIPLEHTQSPSNTRNERNRFIKNAGTSLDDMQALTPPSVGSKHS